MQCYILSDQELLGRNHKKLKCKSENEHLLSNIDYVVIHFSYDMGSKISLVFSHQ